MFQLCRQPITIDQADLPFGLSCGVCALETTACLILVSNEQMCTSGSDWYAFATGNRIHYNFCIPTCLSIFNVV